MNTPPIPQTDSIRALARFWDEHDLSDFEDQLEEVGEPVFDSPQAITVRLGSPEAEAVRRIAQARGLAPPELIRQWVHERLRAG